MPTVSGSGGDEVESQDEIKVFKYEGDEDESEKTSAGNLNEDKSSLITETEEEKSSHVPSSSSYAAACLAKGEGRLPDTPPFGFFGAAAAWGADRFSYLSPLAYAYTNGTSAMAAEKMGLGAGPASSALFSLYPPGQPPPAHMGISPYQLDAKAGLRSHMYPLAASGQYTYPLGADLTAQMASAAWFSPGGLIPPHPGFTPPLSHPLVASPKPETPNTSHDNHRHPSLMEQKPSLGGMGEKTSLMDGKNGDKKPHIKKPLNAFMLYMKEMRAKVVAECTLKESAAINQILGRKWHALSREEQAKYYEMARRERQLHMQMYPGWSSRQNYSQGKKKKRNREKNIDGANMKKCRARFGLEQQSQWCKPCRRKKKCIRYMEGEEGGDDPDFMSSDLQNPLESDSEDDDYDFSMSSPSAHEGDHSPSSSNLVLSPGLSLSSPSATPSSSHAMMSPGLSLSSPSAPSSLLLPSPSSLSSPLTPNEARDAISLSFGAVVPHPVRVPVGTNPRDVNNPLSVNQLTGQCSGVKDDPPGQETNSRHTMVSVT